MSKLQEVQIQMEKEKVVDTLRKRGRSFSEYEIQHMMSGIFTKYTVGLPYYKNLNIERFSRSDKEVYNQSFKYLEVDLAVLYKTHSYHFEETTYAKKQYDVEIKKAIDKIQEVESRLKKLMKVIKERVTYESETIFFHDLSLINTKNLLKHNVARSSSEINFSSGLATNPNSSSPSKRYDISGAELNITTNAESVSVSDNREVLFNDNQLSALHIKTESNSSNPQRVSLDIDLKKEYSCTHIELSGFSMFSDILTLFISSNGIDYYRRENIVGKNGVIWNFPKTAVRYIRILLEKTNPNLIGSVYETTTDLIALSVSESTFEQNAVLTTEVIPIANGSTVSIEPIHYTPLGAVLSYFIGYEDKNKNVEWFDIDPFEELDMGLFNHKEFFPTYLTSNYFGQWDYCREYGTELFYIHELEDDVLEDNVEVRAGYKQWLIESIDISTEDAFNIPEDEKPRLIDYDINNIVGIFPMDMNNTAIRCEKEHNYFSMGAFVVAQEEEVIRDRFIFLKDQEDEVLNVSLYVNGQEILPNGGRYSFSLNKGENHVRLLIYMGYHNYDLDDLDNVKNIIHNFNVLSSNNDVFASAPLSRVHFNSLDITSHKHKLDKFAIKAMNGKKYIMTKFDVNYILSVHESYTGDKRDLSPYKSNRGFVNNSEFFRMLIKYKYMTEETKEMLGYKENGNHVHYRVMAKLTTNDRNVSPFIKEIKLVVK